MGNNNPRKLQKAKFGFATHWQLFMDFPGVSVVKNSLPNAGDEGDVDLIPGSGRSSGGEHGNPHQ